MLPRSNEPPETASSSSSLKTRFSKETSRFERIELAVCVICVVCVCVMALSLVDCDVTMKFAHEIARIASPISSAAGMVSIGYFTVEQQKLSLHLGEPGPAIFPIEQIEQC